MKPTATLVVLTLSLLSCLTGATVSAQTRTSATVVSPTPDPITDANAKVLDSSTPPTTPIFNPGWNLRCGDHPVPLTNALGAQLTWGAWTNVTGTANLACATHTDASGKAI